MPGFKIPDHDYVEIDKPDEVTEVFTYYVGDKVVGKCKIVYADIERRSVESAEWINGAAI